MMADDAQLLAYVDGELPADQIDAIETQLRDSADARDKVARLRASQVDFAAAFADRALPPVPQSLTQSVDELVRAHRMNRANASNASNATPLPASTKPARAARNMPLWLAAACVAGAFACGLLLRGGVLSGASDNGGAGGAPQVASAGVSPWIAAAVGYQKLYTRDTVAHLDADPKTAATIVGEIRRDDRIAVRVPDLSSAGLTFKAVQRLRFNGKPLVQLVYLPKEGAPIALCVMKDARPDERVDAKTVDAMNVVTWREAELNYALIGETGGVDLRALGERIANRDAAPLFGDAANVTATYASLDANAGAWR